MVQDKDKVYCLMNVSTIGGFPGPEMAVIEVTADLAERLTGYTQAIASLDTTPLTVEYETDAVTFFKMDFSLIQLSQKVGKADVADMYDVLNRMEDPRDFLIVESLPEALQAMIDQGKQDQQYENFSVILRGRWPDEYCFCGKMARSSITFQTEYVALNDFKHALGLNKGDQR